MFLQAWLIIPIVVAKDAHPQIVNGKTTIDDVNNDFVIGSFHGALEYEAGNENLNIHF